MDKVWKVDLAVRNAKATGEFLLLILIRIAARRVALAGNCKKAELGVLSVMRCTEAVRVGGGEGDDELHVGRKGRHTGEKCSCRTMTATHPQLA